MGSSFVYIIATGKNGQVQTGMTNNLVHRAWQHRTGQREEMGSPAICSKLVWHEAFSDPAAAEAQLDRLSRWPDAWVSRLIEENNPDWEDQWAGLKDQPTIGFSPAFSQNSANSTSIYPVLRPMLKVA